MDLNEKLTMAVESAVENLYGTKPEAKLIQLQKTRKEIDGDATVVVFPLLRVSKKSPEQTANEIGAYLVDNFDEVVAFSTIKGFLNLNISDDYYLSFFNLAKKEAEFGYKKITDKSEKVMVEYSSPNTNKPLHLGHIRNNLLGNSVCRILKANGKVVIKTNIVNDRGIHICKSMLAWSKWGNEATPLSTGIKGDKLVGDYYVKFDQEYKAEIKQIIKEKISEYDVLKDVEDFSSFYSMLKSKKETKEGLNEDEIEQLKACEEISNYAENNAPLIMEARGMLRKWEAKDPEVMELWTKMNQWVYDGFDITYKRLGIDFDKIYYESDTYLVGRDTVLNGLEKGLFIREEDQSVWADLREDGLDKKILLRSDGTSVYMTQDIGTAQLRQNDYNPDKMVYVVGNEQNYHFKVLSLILDKLGFSWAKSLFHMSYGMVELPEGKMKSREGTVVDADDLMDEMIANAHDMSNELGKLDDFSDEEKLEVSRIVGLGALKYFILKVDPVKNMTFNPKESIDFNGNTGPFIQYTYARIQSVIKKANDQNIMPKGEDVIGLKLTAKEKSLLKQVHNYPEIVEEAGINYSPAVIANYIYDLVKEYNQFYHDHNILREEKETIRSFRLMLSEMIAKIVESGMNLLGIEVPDRM